MRDNANVRVEDLQLESRQGDAMSTALPVARIPLLRIDGNPPGVTDFATG